MRKHFGADEAVRASFAFHHTGAEAAALETIAG